jgi:hypothetical protein
MYPNQNSGLTSRVKKFGNLMKMGISVRISGDIQTGVKEFVTVANTLTFNPWLALIQL